MLTLNDGRSELWQWDTKRKLTVDAECSQVHFSNKVFGRSIDIDVIDGVATIPDILLQTDKELTAWAFVGTAENGYTKISKVFKVNKRNKPADYVFTPPEQTTIAEIMERIDDLEAIQDPDAIKNAVDDYLANNPIKVEETDPTIPDWAKQPNPPYVKIPDKLPNPYSITFTGAVNASYDGSSAVEIKIPDSGGNADQTEPMEDDIPKVFFGAALPQTKDDTIMPFRYISKTKDISGYCKTKAQGNSSMAFPKKNQTVKLYADAECIEKLKVDFKGWGKQNKFCFKANWIDLTHARNIVSARLWGDVVKSRQNYEEIPELLRTSPNQGAVNGFPVKVYAGGVYQGRYTLNIPKDAWMANMDDELDTHCILCGENYESGCFRAEAVIDGSDWTDEIHDTVPNSIKTRWNEAIRFVLNSTDEEFVAGIDNYFDVDSLIDYYIFGVLINNRDGFGKNQLYMTYDGQKWYATVYDMDCVFGTYFDALLEYDYPRTSFEDFLQDREGNLLYIRLEKLFTEQIKTRYMELKDGVLSLPNIINHFERFTDIAPPDLVEEDYAETTAGGAFTAIPLQTQSNIQQIRDYIINRYPYVESYILSLGVTGNLLYRLPEETTFDGVDDYIDTGVKLFDEPKDFTIICDATYEEGIDTYKGIYTAWQNDTGGEYQACGIFCTTVCLGNDGYGFTVANGTDLSGSTVAITCNTPGICKHALVVRAGKLSAVHYATTAGSVATATAPPEADVYYAHNHTLTIGCSVGWWQTRENFTSMTMHNFEIWDYAMTAEEFAEKLA